MSVSCEAGTVTRRLFWQRGDLDGADGMDSSRRFSSAPILRYASAALVTGLLTLGAAAAETFVVTTTEDDVSTPGSLRWAVERCRYHPGPDTVSFAIPTSDQNHDPELGVWTIKSAPNLRYGLGDSTVVDGDSQARFIGGDPNPYGPEIELVGPDSGPPVGCISVSKDDVVIRGLCIHGYAGGGIDIHGFPQGELAERVVVAGCYLNVDPTGTYAMGNGREGISTSHVSDLRIGGDAPEDRNIISSGINWEVRIHSSSNVEIINNFIGCDRTGTADLSSHSDWGLWIHHNAGPCLARDNVIVGGDRDWLVDISYAESDSGVVTFVGNRVGVSLDGTPMGAHVYNIMIEFSRGHLIRDNIIAYASVQGVEVRAEPTDYVTFSRNSIYANGGLGINLSQWGSQSPWNGVDYADGVYGPGVNEEIDPPLCDWIATTADGPGGTTSVQFRAMPQCVVEIFIGDPDDAAGCSEPGYGAVHSGITYLGDAREAVAGDPWSAYRFSTSPALPAGTFVTATATNQNGSTSEFGCTCQVPVMGATDRGCLPPAYRLAPPSPNPCSVSTVLRYDLPEGCHVRITVYDATGRQVAVLVDGEEPAGIHAVRWRPEHPDGEALPGGLYLLRLTSDQFVASERVVVVR